MKLSTHNRSLYSFSLVSTCLVLLWLATRAGAGGQTTRPSPSHQPCVHEVQCLDGSSLKLALLDVEIELITPYGRLLIPTTDIQRIEFATRFPPDVTKRINNAVADLSSADYKRRQLASAELLALEEKAYPALQEAARGTDLEAMRRAEVLLQKIRETVPAERLAIRTDDVVYTAKSKIAGRLTAAAFRVRTALFGEQQLSLAAVRYLGQGSLSAASSGNALPDPGTLASYQNQVGQTLTFRITGATAGRGGVWGTDVYTLDTTLSLAAVHAGLLREGETGTVRVTLVGPVLGFQGSTRHGITSSAYGQYPGYRVAR